MIIKHDTFMTQSNRLVSLSDPRVSDISLYDILTGLSQTCRFGGHVPEHYSVAQHSVVVSRLVRREHAVLALFHDASEAYLGDCISPLKALLPEYRAIERRWQLVIGQALGLGDALADLPEDVHEADRTAFHMEWRDVTNTRPALPFQPVDLPAWRIFPRAADEARLLFMRRFEELTGRRISC